MFLYRISKEKYIRDLSGEGARKYGGRWNHKGMPVLYTSEHLSLAALEVLVHVPVISLPKDLKLLKLKISDKASREEVDPAILPANWKEYPAPTELKDLGTEWIEHRNSLLLKVPSAVISSECNYLINPLHEEFEQITIDGVEDFMFDSRISKS